MKFGPDKLLCLWLFLLLPFDVAAQESRLALVIGNSTYADSPLNNPENDATDMASVLEDLGFTVILRTDADRREMGRAIREFGRELKKHRGVGLFYYAGHGMQIDNRNYLIPINTPMEEEDEVPYESIDVGSVLAKMESAGNALNLIILDACRNNPFPGRFRSTNRGLARVEAPIGSLVVYATAPGAVAADGDGRNGVFTGALLDQLRTTGLSLTQTIRRTRAAVVEATNGLQVPWESSSLLKDYYFTKKPEEILDADASSSLSGESIAAVSESAARTSVDKAAETTEFQKNNIQTPKTVAKAPTHTDQQLVTTPEDEDSASLTAPIESSATLNIDPETETETITLAYLDKPTPIRPEPPAADSDKSQIIQSTPEHSKPQTLQQTGLSALTVDVTPSDARVRIMNIIEKYKPGIMLDKSREYDIYITRKGYDAYRENISLTDDITALTITLHQKVIAEPEMIAIAGGSYTMGCTSGDNQCESYEKPAHTVRIQPYFISATEVSVGQFDSFIANTGYTTDAEKNTGANAGCFVWSDSGGISRSEAKWAWDRNKNWRNPGYRQTPEHPVTCISWNDANRYAQWLSKRTGKAYALPSESEWELAARAASQGKFGKAGSASELCAIANVADNSESPSGSKWANRVNCTDNYWFSAPVASYQANSFGLYDMQGNVWEWVADTWSDSFSNVPANGSPNQGTSADNSRVLRGGGWESDAKRTRLSTRSKAGASSRASMTGFRLVIRRGSR